MELEAELLKARILNHFPSLFLEKEYPYYKSFSFRIYTSDDKSKKVGTITISSDGEISYKENQFDTLFREGRGYYGGFESAYLNIASKLFPYLRNKLQLLTSEELLDQSRALGEFINKIRTELPHLEGNTREILRGVLSHIRAAPGSALYEEAKTHFEAGREN